MKIACLGWGSLIWEPKELEEYISSEWHVDGPDLPVEFARESGRNRITLVLVEGAKCSPSLWAMLNVANIDDAKSALAKREGISDKFKENSIGFWDAHSNKMHGKCANVISQWALEKGLDGVVWTNLKAGTGKIKNGVAPTLDEIIKYFNDLDDCASAEEYVRKTPAQVRTEFRSGIEEQLGWYPI